MRNAHILMAILCAVVLLVLAPASAYVEQVNVLDQRTDVMPSGLFMFFAAVAVISLVVAYRWNDEMAEFIALAAGFIVMWTSRHIDYTTGIAYNTTTTTVVHTIVQPDIATLFGGICFLLALFNLLRLILLSRQGNGMDQGGQQ